MLSRRPHRPEAYPPAVLLGGETGTVSVARSLGAAGVPVYALGTGSWNPVRYSRHCRTYVAFDGEGDGIQASWLEWLEGGPRGAVLLPCNDEGVELVARNRTALLDLGYRVGPADPEVMVAMLDKHQTDLLARRLDIPVPRTRAVHTSEDLDSAAREIGFPCALKPSHSHVFLRRIDGTKAFVVDDREALEAAFRRAQAAGLEMVLTETIPGGDDRLCSYYTYIGEDGEPLFHFTRRKIRQYPTRFGVACYHVTEWIPDLAELGSRFLRGANVRGPGHVEFKRDPRDGQLKLIECNHRFTNVTESLRLAGVDVPLLAYNRIVGLPGPDVDSFREGVRMWHPVEDVRAFMSYRSRDELSFRQWVGSLSHRQHLPVFKLSDPRPTITNLQRLLAEVARRLDRLRRPGNVPRP